jgi:hypothetical protein
MNRIIPTLGLALMVVASAGASSAFAECRPGSPHCIPTNITIPKFCGTPGGKACTIDGGLGSSCKGGGTCGTGPEGPPGNVWFPYGDSQLSVTQSLTVDGGNSAPQPGIHGRLAAKSAMSSAAHLRLH